MGLEHIQDFHSLPFLFDYEIQVHTVYCIHSKKSTLLEGNLQGKEWNMALPAVHYFLHRDYSKSNKHLYFSITKHILTNHNKMNKLIYLGSTICSLWSKQPMALYLVPVPHGILSLVRHVDQSDNGNGKYCAHGQGIFSSRGISWQDLCW